MSKLHSKVSPSLPAATDPLPNIKYEAVKLNELVVQEAKKDERAVSTLHNTQTNHINSMIYIYFLHLSFLRNRTININRAVEPLSDGEEK